MDKDLRLAIEPPIHLTDDAIKGLREDRSRLQSWSKDSGIPLFDASETRENDTLKVLERAWIDTDQGYGSENTPIASRLQKLWSERGDFSRFRASELKEKLQDSESSPSKVGNATIFDANLDDILSEGDDEGEEDPAKRKKDTSVRHSKDVMSIEEMRQLRTDMLAKLGVSQTSLYFSHALISLLINSTKTGLIGENSLSTSNSVAAGRAASPASLGPNGVPVAGIPSSVSAMQRSTIHGNALGSASNLEAELGIEPQVFGASHIEATHNTVDDTKASDDGEGEDEDEKENVVKTLARQRRENAQLHGTELMDGIQNKVECLEGKRDGLKNAISILRRGAHTLDPSTPTALKDKRRWRGLMIAKQTGWGLTPDKPIRGTANNRRELLDDGQKRREEPSRDAWIGYAVPEASQMYRRRALAYFSHAINEEDESKNLADDLLFASRPKKLLQIEFVVDQHVWTSVSSLCSSQYYPDSGIDSELRKAQSELFDQELFDTLMAEARSFSTTWLNKVSITDTESASIQVNDMTLFRFSMTSQETEQESDNHITDNKIYPSPVASLVLTILQLRLLSRYRARAGIQQDPKQQAVTSNMPLLQPIFGLIHYSSFVVQLQYLLSKLTHASTPFTFSMEPLKRVRDLHIWMDSFLLKPNESQGVPDLGGYATVYREGGVFALLDMSYPSHIALTLPQKGNDGVRLGSLDLFSLEKILCQEMKGC